MKCRAVFFCRECWRGMIKTETNHKESNRDSDRRQKYVGKGKESVLSKLYKTKMTIR
jgi:hypothetical protein